MRISGIIERFRKRRQDASVEDKREIIQPEAEDAPEGQEMPSEEESEEEEDCGMRHLDVELTEEQWKSMKDFMGREIGHFSRKPEKTDRTLMLLSALRKMSLGLQAAQRTVHYE